MSDPRSIPNHRNSRRSISNKDILIEIGPYSQKVGPVTRIDSNGIEFKYRYMGETKRESSELNIWANGKLYLSKVPFRTISETPELFKKDQTVYTSKRCQVEIIDLSTIQQKKFMALKDIFKSGK